MNAIEIIKKSAVMHESLLIEALENRAYDDARYMATRETPAIKRAVQASFDATHRAIDAVKNGEIDSLYSDMGAGIIALNVACRLLCVPPYVRTQAAIETWEKSQETSDARISNQKPRGHSVRVWLYRPA